MVPILVKVVRIAPRRRWPGGHDVVSQGRWQQGQALVETALAFPVLLIVALALVQFALFTHAENVVTGAVQDGARVAASEDRTIGDGIAHTQALLRGGLGQEAGRVQIRGVDGGDAVSIEARGHLTLIVPWVADATLPIGAKAVVQKERFSSRGR